MAKPILATPRLNKRESKRFLVEMKRIKCRRPNKAEKDIATLIIESEA